MEIMLLLSIAVAGAIVKAVEETWGYTKDNTKAARTRAGEALDRMARSDNRKLSPTDPRWWGWAGAALLWLAGKGLKHGPGAVKAAAKGAREGFKEGKEQAEEIKRRALEAREKLARAKAHRDAKKMNRRLDWTDLVNAWDEEKAGSTNEPFWRNDWEAPPIPTLVRPEGESPAREAPQYPTAPPEALEAAPGHSAAGPEQHTPTQPAESVSIPKIDGTYLPYEDNGWTTEGDFVWERVPGAEAPASDQLIPGPRIPQIAPDDTYQVEVLARQVAGPNGTARPQGEIEEIVDGELVEGDHTPALAGSTSMEIAMTTTTPADMPNTEVQGIPGARLILDQIKHIILQEQSAAEQRKNDAERGANRLDQARVGIGSLIDGLEKYGVDPTTIGDAMIILDEVLTAAGAAKRGAEEDGRAWEFLGNSVTATDITKTNLNIRHGNVEEVINTNPVKVAALDFYTDGQ